MTRQRKKRTYVDGRENAPLRQGQWHHIVTTDRYETRRQRFRAWLRRLA